MATPEVRSQRTRTYKLHVSDHLPARAILGKTFVKRELVSWRNMHPGKSRKGHIWTANCLLDYEAYFC